jgi:CHAT domain-containing protein
MKTTRQEETNGQPLLLSNDCLIRRESMPLRLDAPAFSFKTSRRLLYRGLLLLLILSLMACAIAAQDSNNESALEPGKPIERELAGGQSHFYHLALTAGQYMHVVVDQRGIDVVVTLFAPNGIELIKVDSPNGTTGPEPVFWIAESSGTYRLEVSPLGKNAVAGRYQARIQELRAATAQDTNRLAAERLVNEGAQLVNEGSKDSLEQALQKFEQARPLFHSINDALSEAVTLNKIGRVYDDLGEKQKALDNYALALPLRRAVGDRGGEATTLTNIGAVYDNLGERQKALDNYALALPLFRAIGNRGGEAITLNNIGAVYDNLGEKQKALDNYALALPLLRAVGDRRREANTLNNIGLVYYSLGETQKALDNFALALPLLRTVGDRGGEAITLNNIGGAYDNLGEKQKALDNYALALPLLRTVGDRGGEANTLYNLAYLERDQGQLTEARANIEAAIAIIESLRTKITNQELRSSYFATVQSYYEFYIDLLMRLHKQSPNAGHDGEALQTSERARARALLETLAEANADIRQGVDPMLVEHERTLQIQLNAKAQEQMKLLSGAHTEAQAKAIAGEIEALTTEFQQVETQIRQTSPRYAALTQPQPLTLKEVQANVLDRDTLLLEYSLGTERSYLWAVTPDSITSYELPKRDDIESAARRVYDILNARNQTVEGEMPEQRRARIARADAHYTEAAAQLSGKILAPVAKQLGNKRLLVVADGVLQYIPFAALIDPSGDSAPLVVKHEIVSLPSASTINVLRREIKDRKPAAKTVAVLADPVFEDTDERVKNVKSGAGAAANRQRRRTRRRRDLPLGMEQSLEESGLRDAGFEIPRLPGTRLEAGKILALVPASESKQAFDFAASRATATASDLAQYRFIHFATHGFLNSLHPELSGIVLSMVDEKGTAQDGFLRANDIFNLKLPAELVVLSACQTGLGKEIKGEGLIGLTRGFMYAGAPRVVVSLWSVSDAGTSELMTRFYRAMLKDKMRPAQALRAAQVSLLKEKRWGQPFYWAAFTLQGEWR